MIGLGIIFLCKVLFVYDLTFFKCLKSEEIIICLCKGCIFPWATFSDLDTNSFAMLFSFQSGLKPKSQCRMNYLCYVMWLTNELWCFQRARLHETAKTIDFFDIFFENGGFTG